MIATSHPLSTAAGLELLQRGGNAVDAGLAAVAVQCVVDPLMTGIGGDCFALYTPANGVPKALNGSGRTPTSATIEALRSSGLTDEIPQTSPHSVTVPGAVSAWCRLHADHGSLPLRRIFDRAIAYATDGYRVSPRVAVDWAANAELIGGDAGAAAIFLPEGKAPKPGAWHRQPLLAQRLTEIGDGGAQAFYEGETAAAMVAYLSGLGGFHTMEDFALGRDGSEWVKPISASYRGFEIHQCPPNGQGLAALLILKIMEGFDLSQMAEADRIHLHAEATKTAYLHRDMLIADPKTCLDVTDRLLNVDAISAMRAKIDMDHACEPVIWDEPEHRDTVYLSVVDEQGNALSLINSIFHGFGSTRLDPQTGVLFHSRGSSFRLIDDHPNVFAPGKRPMHTIIPGMVMQNGKSVMPFGVMGGHYQAAGHAAFLSAVIDRGLELQDAMDEPRSFAFNGVLEIEPRIPIEVQEELRRRGHKLQIAASPIGGSQAIRITILGLEGGSDSRKDGMALGF